MKVASITATVYSHRFDGVAVTQGVGRVVKRDLVLVRVTAEDGTVGYGEAHHGLNPTAVAEVVNHTMAPVVVGTDALAHEDAWERVSRHQIVTHGLGAGSVIALSGIDIALWDLRGKLLRTPVFRQLGGTRRAIRAYAGGMGLGWQPDAELEREVTRLVEAGYTAVKLRVGQELGADASRVRHIRQAFGPGLDIAVDAATRYVGTDMRRVVRYCEDNDVMWLEEPFTPDNLAAYAELRRMTGIPVAAGENHFTKHVFRDLMVAAAIDVVQADCTKAGGLTEVKKIADMAAAWHLRMAPHTGQSAISVAANVHLLCAVPNRLIFEADISPINPWRDLLAANPLAVRNGVIEPNEAPGLGLDIDEDMLAHHAAIPGACYVPPG